VDEVSHTSEARRRFLALAAGGLATGLVAGTPPSTNVPRRPPKAILFDAFPVFDPRPVFARAEAMFPDKGVELAALWRARQFEYTWLRAAGRRYEDFWRVTEDALVAAARALGLELCPAERARLMGAYLELTAYPDVPAALARLEKAGIRLALLSNLTPRMLDASIENAGLRGVFERALSTDGARTYKPDPRAYQLGLDAMRVGREDAVFAAFAGWDVAGASWFGYRTYWVNRARQPAEALGGSAVIDSEHDDTPLFGETR
jgi:2-haloacid dehalogenase